MTETKIRRRRGIFAALALFWLIFVGGGIGLLAIQSNPGTYWCDSPPSGGFESTIGTPHFHWRPFGVECVYTKAENGVDGSQEPGPLPTIWLIASAFVTVAAAFAFVVSRGDAPAVDLVDDPVG